MYSGFRIIPLRNGGETKVDADDYDFLMQWKWSGRTSVAGLTYVYRTNPKGIMPTTVWMHRVINNTPKGYPTDHINLDTLDNRRSNLRTSTASLNGRNIRRQKNNRSGFTGVHLERLDIPKPWRAEATVNRKKVQLGYYKTPEEASAAYQVFTSKLLETRITV